MNFKVQIDPFIVGVVNELQSAGYEAYIVGGAVRDIILNRRPKDYDIATEATPEQIRSVFQGKQHTIIIGRRFRLVHLLRGDTPIEISTFRKTPNLAAQQDERPERAKDAPDNMIFRDNEFGDARDDAYRRDFTINALFYDPIGDRIEDHTGLGLKDIQDRCVRIIGDPQVRFEEDPVRVLRALKLVGQYGFTLEPETEAALRASTRFIAHVSQARLSLELEKILKGGYADKIFQAFRNFGFLSLFLPYLNAVYDTPDGQTAMQLLAKRNERLNQDKFRDSMSLAISCVALPFANPLIQEAIAAGHGEPYEGIERDLKDLILEIFTPHLFMRRTTIAVIRSLLIQPYMHDLQNVRMFAALAGYPTARELAIIQNECLWHIPDYEQNCPGYRKSPNSPRNPKYQKWKKKKHDNHSPNRNNNNSRPEDWQPRGE